MEVATWSVHVADQRECHIYFSSFFSCQDELCFCNDVTGLFKAIWIFCNLSEWCPFIDSSCRCLKAVLLHNQNMYPSLSLAHSMQLKEEYSCVKIMLNALKYKDYRWEVIRYLKIELFLIGLQGSFIKYPCHICLWDSRDTEERYHRKDWSGPIAFNLGRNYVKWEPLVDQRKVMFYNCT